MSTEASGGAAAGRDEWDSHWDDYGAANERNPAQRFRRQLVLRALEREGPPRRLLDIGSGNGELLRAATARWPDAELLGLELSAAGVAASKAIVPTARFRVCNLLTEPEPPADERHWATHAACSEVLEHVDEPAELLGHARAWLAPGCLVVITVPGGPMSAFDQEIGHRRHFSAEDLRALIEQVGLQPIECTGAGFPFFNLYRALVIARGDSLVDAARADRLQSPSGVILRAGMAAFRPLLTLSAGHSSRGWQTIGLAREPRVAAADAVN